MGRAAAFPFLLIVAGWVFGGQQDAPSHGRPFFMPAAERDRIRALVDREPAAGQPSSEAWGNDRSHRTACQEQLPHPL